MKNFFDLKDFRENYLKITQTEFASMMGIRQDTVSRAEKNPDQLSLSLLMAIAEKTGMTPDQLIKYKKPMPTPLYPERKWGKLKNLKESIDSVLEKYNNALNDKESKKVLCDLRKISQSLIRKPKFIFGGRSDSGKSTMINALLGKNILPVSWSPTTSAVIYIKSIDDRPSFINDELWVFKKGENGELWDDSLLAEDKAEECKAWKIAGGNSALLCDYGTRSGEMFDEDKIGSAVLFADCEVLKNCDFADVPGFAGGLKNDNDSAVKAQSGADVLIYLSPANGFLSAEDIAHIKEGLKHLPVLTDSKTKKALLLRNLYITATQAHIVDGGNAEKINLIKESGADRFAKAIQCTSEETSSPLFSKEIIKSRFFSYSTDIELLRKDFENDLTELIQLLPDIIFENAVCTLKNICEDTVKESENNIRLLNDKISSEKINTEQIDMLLKNASKLKPKQIDKKEAVIKEIDECRRRSFQEIQSDYNRILNEDHIISIINDRKFKSNKNDLELLCSVINSELDKSIGSILKNNTDKLNKCIDDYIVNFTETEKSTPQIDKNLLGGFNAKRAFASGLAGVSTLGGLAAWASSMGNLGGYILISKAVSVLSALGISIPGGTAAVISAISAIGGPAVLGIALSVLTALTAFGFFSSGWKKKSAKKIISAYDDQKASEKYMTVTERYWNQTEYAFLIASAKMEKEFEAALIEMQKSVNNFNSDLVSEKIKNEEIIKKAFEDIKNLI